MKNNMTKTSCEHKFSIKFAGSAYVTYCEKCGKIGEVKEMSYVKPDMETPTYVEPYHITSNNNITLPYLEPNYSFNQDDAFLTSISADDTEALRGEIKNYINNL